MKRVVYALIGLALFSSDLLFQSSSWPVAPIHAAAAFLTSIGVADTDQSGSETSGNWDTTGATLLFFCYGNYAGGGGTDAGITPVSSPVNTWTALTYRSSGAFGAAGRCYYVASPTTSATTTVTISSGGGNQFACGYGMAFSGTLASSPFDAESGAGSATPGSITPGANNETGVLFAAFGDNGLSIDISSLNASYTLAGNRIVDSVATYGCGGGYTIQTTATASNPTVTLSGVETGTATVQAFFKQAAAATAQCLGMLLGVGC